MSKNEMYTVRITLAAASHTGKRADAELVFVSGPLAGLRLIGFQVWEHHHTGSLTVTPPSRQYSVNGERRSYALLRPIDPSDAIATENIRVLLDTIRDAYRDAVAATTS